nr:hypothetical protein [Tanacetum cinerariifolium]
DAGQGSATGDSAGDAADPGWPLRLPLCAAESVVGLGRGSGAGAGRHVQSGADPDRAALA